MIKIGIIDDHVISAEALGHYLNANSDFEASVILHDRLALIEHLKRDGINVLVICINEIGFEILNLIRHISLSYDRVRQLVVARITDDTAVLKCIKAGAKGFLAKDSDCSELTEAIYTLRNGYDFYSSSVAHLLLNKYIASMKDDERPAAPGLETLSSRQIEILKLWGNSLSNQEIADKLYLSVRTVESHKTHIMQKLNLKTTIDMIKFGIKNNLIEI